MLITFFDFTGAVFLRRAREKVTSGMQRRRVARVSVAWAWLGVAIQHRSSAVIAALWSMPRSVWACLEMELADGVSLGKEMRADWKEVGAVEAREATPSGKMF
jgi:hypothetical protein